MGSEKGNCFFDSCLYLRSFVIGLAMLVLVVFYVIAPIKEWIYIFLFFLVCLLYDILKLYTIEMVITNKRVIYRKGIISIKTEELKTNIIEWLFNCNFNRTIETLILQGARFDTLGVGDNISKPEGRMGCVYKETALRENGVLIPKIISRLTTKFLTGRKM